MACFRPLQPPDELYRVPCGQCIGCRLERSRQWAVRMMHEASLHSRNSFLTLTYDRKNLPCDGSLDLRHFQLFMMRLRRQRGPGIRFFHCGEYGDKLLRPHYHAILFNCDFPDQVPCEDNLFRSDSLDSFWGMGRCWIGPVTFESAAYVARYCTKKVNGFKAADHYQVWDIFTGEVITQRKPEYATMSRRPGLGQGWYDKFKGDIYPKDSFHMDGRELRPPRFYDRKFDLEQPEVLDWVKFERQLKARQKWRDNVPSRLTAKEYHKSLCLKQLKRRFESGT